MMQVSLHCFGVDISSCRGYHLGQRLPKKVGKIKPLSLKMKQDPDMVKEREAEMALTCNILL